MRFMGYRKPAVMLKYQALAREQLWGELVRARPLQRAPAKNQRDGGAKYQLSPRTKVIKKVHRNRLNTKIS